MCHVNSEVHAWLSDKTIRQSHHLQSMEWGQEWLTTTDVLHKGKGLTSGLVVVRLVQRSSVGCRQQGKTR